MLTGYSNDSLIVQDAPLNLNFDSLSIDKIYRVPVSKYDCLIPVLKTAMCTPRRQTSTEVLLALFKRNFNVPSLQGLIDEELMINDCVNNFINSYIPECNLPILKQCTDNPVYPSTTDIQNWLNDQENNVRGLLGDVYESLWEKDLGRYDLSIKKLAKPPLLNSETDIFFSTNNFSAFKINQCSILSPIQNLTR